LPTLRHLAPFRHLATPIIDYATPPAAIQPFSITPFRRFAGFRRRFRFLRWPPFSPGFLSIRFHADIFSFALFDIFRFH